VGRGYLTCQLVSFLSCLLILQKPLHLHSSRFIPYSPTSTRQQRGRSDQVPNSCCLLSFVRRSHSVSQQGPKESNSLSLFLFLSVSLSDLTSFATLVSSRPFTTTLSNDNQLFFTGQRKKKSMTSTVVQANGIADAKASAMTTEDAKVHNKKAGHANAGSYRHTYPVHTKTAPSPLSKEAPPESYRGFVNLGSKFLMLFFTSSIWRFWERSIELLVN